MPSSLTPARPIPILIGDRRSLSFSSGRDAMARRAEKTKDGPGCPLFAEEEPDLRPAEGPEADEDLAGLARALGHPARVRILRLLLRRQPCVCGDIVTEVGSLAQSTVSQHLKVLKEAGLVWGDAKGPCVCYGIVPRALRRLKVLVAGL
jgi:ArsR family transcriptional regulator